jgi:hypothetical protein
MVSWKPAYELRKKGKDKKPKIWPVNPILPIFYTNMDADGLYYPLFVREIKKAYGMCKAKLSNHGKNKLDIHTHEDIALMLSTLSKTLKGNKRFSQIRPVFHKGNVKYSLDTKGKLVKERDDTWVSRTAPFSISHNVAQRKKALGANGCTDCHAKEAHLFSGTVVTDVFGPEGKPLTVRAGEKLGFDSLTFRINFFFQYYLTRILPTLAICLVILITFLMLRYIGRRNRGTRAGDEISPELVRFNRSEVWASIFRLVVFLFLIAAAHLLVFANVGMLSLFASIYKKTVGYAGVIGIIFFAVSIVGYAFFVTTKPDKLPRTFRRKIFWLANILALIMVVTGILLLFFQENVSVTANLFISSLHGVIAMFFLAAVFIFAYLTISDVLAKRRKDEAET